MSSKRTLRPVGGTDAGKTAGSDGAPAVPLVVIKGGGTLASVAGHPGETVAVLTVAAVYVALQLLLPWRALTRTKRTAAAAVHALAGVTALGVTTAVALADDPAFSPVSFVQSPVLIAAGATAAALLALFGALRSI